MKFDIEDLKIRADVVIAAVIEKRGEERREISEKLAKAEAEWTTLHGNDWADFAEEIRESVRNGEPIYRKEKTPPPTVEDLYGYGYGRDMRELKKETRDTPPKALSRFRDFLNIAEGDSISTNELRVHGFANFEKFLNPDSWT